MTAATTPASDRIAQWNRQDAVWHMVLGERDRQDAKWGDQSGHPQAIWAAILGEEFGEVCQAILPFAIEPANSPDGAGTSGIDHLREELVQVAAVAVAWLEALPL